MAAKITAGKSDRADRLAKVTISDRYGNETGISLTETDTASLIYDLIQTLPTDHNIRQYLHI